MGGGGTDFVLEITHLEDQHDFAKSVFLIRYDPNLSKSKTSANGSLECNFLNKILCEWVKTVFTHV